MTPQNDAQKTAAHGNGNGNGIGTLNEKPLHAALKDWLAQPGDSVEVPVDGAVIDLVRDDLLIEIQTRNFSAIRSKLERLSKQHRLRLVYPIAYEKWIVRQDDDGQDIGRRKSPKRGAVVDVFAELIHLPTLLERPGVELDVLLIQEDEVRRHDPERAWRRRGWVTHERRLIDVLDSYRFTDPADLAALLPADLPALFTTADIADALERPRRLAQQMAYCLRMTGLITPVSKRRDGVVYERAK